MSKYGKKLLAQLHVIDITIKLDWRASTVVCRSLALSTVWVSCSSFNHSSFLSLVSDQFLPCANFLDTWSFSVYPIWTHTSSGPLLLGSGSSFCMVLYEWHDTLWRDDRKSNRNNAPSHRAIAANKQNNCKLIGLLHFCPVTRYSTQLGQWMKSNWDFVRYYIILYM